MAPNEKSETVSFNRKDAVLNRLAADFNVAQFVSFSPSIRGPIQEFSRVNGRVANHVYPTVGEAVSDLLLSSNMSSLNVRSFTAASTQSMEFLYGLTEKEAIVQHLSRLSEQGAFTILNETINVSDGGLSGVAMGNLVELRPDATPRGVERPGFASLPLDWATTVIADIYGFDPKIKAAKSGRLEFSVHPIRQGWLQQHTIYWEYEAQRHVSSPIDVSWPNDLSRMLGDKVYGLLIASAAGAAVPKTTVLNRRVAPFTFGTDNGCHERWLRTAPSEQQPGKYTTSFGWQDPFALLFSEDRDGNEIPSVISQQAVPALWSGAALTTSGGSMWVEGVAGTGDRFMLGEQKPEALPTEVKRSVEGAYTRLAEALGPIRLEWAYDGKLTWLLQLHKGASTSDGTQIVPGNPRHWVPFSTAAGLPALRDLLKDLPADAGIVIDRSVGLTSHFADVLRKAKVPSRFS